MTQEDRTDHIDMPPLRGVKWAAKTWVHEKDFITPFLSGGLLSMEKGSGNVDVNACRDHNRECTSLSFGFGVLFWVGRGRRHSAFCNPTPIEDTASGGIVLCMG